MAQLSINETTEKSMDIVVLNQIVEKLNDAELAMEALDKMITYNEIEQSFEAQDVRNLSSYTHLWVNFKNTKKAVLLLKNKTTNPNIKYV